MVSLKDFAHFIKYSSIARFRWGLRQITLASSYCRCCSINSCERRRRSNEDAPISRNVGQAAAYYVARAVQRQRHIRRSARMHFSRKWRQFTSGWPTHWHRSEPRQALGWPQRLETLPYVAIINDNNIYYYAWHVGYCGLWSWRLSICHTGGLYKNGWTDQRPVLSGNSRRPKKQCFRGIFRFSMGRGKEVRCGLCQTTLTSCY